MEDLTDAQIQQYLDDKQPLPMTEDVLAYQRLFAHLKREPSIQPSAAFSSKVVHQFERQRAASARIQTYWLLTVGVFLAMLLFVFRDQPTMSMIRSAFWLAKEWLLLGFVCVVPFLLVEYRLLSRQLAH